MSQFTSSGFARLALVIAMVSIGGGFAYAGDDADDWTHQSLGRGFGDLVKKPVAGNVVGVVRSRVLEGPPASINIEYCEFDNGGTLSEEVVANIPFAWIGVTTLSLAYTSNGDPAIAWTTETVLGGPGVGSSSLYYARRLPGGTWTGPTHLYTHADYGVYSSAPMRTDGGMFVLDLAFDKRTDPNHLDEAHIIFGGRFLYLSEQEYDDGDSEYEEGVLWGMHANTPDGLTPGTEVVIDSYGARGPAQRRPNASLATSAVEPPQLVYEDPEFANTINYATFNTCWTVTPAILAGRNPSLALDPSTGDPRVAYSTTSGLYFAGGAPWTPVLVDSGAGGSVSLAIGAGADMKLVADTGAGGVNAYECVAGVWSIISPYGQVTYNGSDARIALAPGLTTDPWVLVTFDDGLGLAQYGSVIGGCGSAPVARGGAALPSAGRALVPLLAAFGALAVWYGARRRRATQS